MSRYAELINFLKEQIEQSKSKSKSDREQIDALENFIKQNAFIQSTGFLIEKDKDRVATFADFFHALPETLLNEDIIRSLINNIRAYDSRFLPSAVSDYRSMLGTCIQQNVIDQGNFNSVQGWIHEKIRAEWNPRGSFHDIFCEEDKLLTKDNFTWVMENPTLEHALKELHESHILLTQDAFDKIKNNPPLLKMFIQTRQYYQQKGFDKILANQSLADALIRLSGIGVFNNDTSFDRQTFLAIRNHPYPMIYASIVCSVRQYNSQSSPHSVFSFSDVFSSKDDTDKKIIDALKKYMQNPSENIDNIRNLKPGSNFKGILESNDVPLTKDGTLDIDRIQRSSEMSPAPPAQHS